jgi:hypothetical protein
MEGRRQPRRSAGAAATTTTGAAAATTTSIVAKRGAAAATTTSLAPSGAEYRDGPRALRSHHREHLAVLSYHQEDRRRAEQSISPSPDRRSQRRSRSRRRSITPRQSRMRSGSRRRSITARRSRGSPDLEWTIRTLDHLIFVFQDARAVLYRMRI